MAPITQGATVSWNITKLYVVETGGTAPSEILPPSTGFDLLVDFRGSGPGWNALEIAKAPYTVKFYAEGIGKNAEEIDFLPPFSGNLVPGQGLYTVKQTEAGGIAIEGVYRLGCLIEVSPGSGVVGFEENLLLSVAKSA
jgi:hypothetical protein